jgi:hypothetical protein
MRYPFDRRAIALPPEVNLVKLNRGAAR